MRVGVVGCGYWGSKHLRVLHSLPEVDTVTAIDPRPDRLAEVGASLPGMTTRATVQDALGEIDALIVATPPSTHADIALQAMREGKHVLIEKPLATSAVDAVALTRFAKETGLTLMVGHTFRYNPAVWKLRELIEGGSLGEIFYIDTARLNLGLYQADCNVIWDLAPHDVSIINYLLGGRPTSVRAWGVVHAHPRFVDVAYLSLEYTHRQIWAQVHVSWLDPCKVRRVTVVGSRQMAVYNDLADDERVRIYDKGVDLPPVRARMHERPLTYRYGGISAPYIPFREPLATEDEDFLDSISRGVEPHSDGQSGVDVVLTLEAVDRALLERRAVNVDEVAADAGLDVPLVLEPL
jgi:predicted dehydrogenase